MSYRLQTDRQADKHSKKRVFILPHQLKIQQIIENYNDYLRLIMKTDLFISSMLSFTDLQLYIVMFRVLVHYNLSVPFKTTWRFCRKIILKLCKDTATSPASMEIQELRNKLTAYLNDSSKCTLISAYQSIKFQHFCSSTVVRIHNQT